MDITQKPFGAELRSSSHHLYRDDDGEKEIVYWWNYYGTKEENNEMLGLVRSTVCSRDVDVYSDRQKKVKSFWNVDRKNEMFIHLFCISGLVDLIV